MCRRVGACKASSTPWRPPNHYNRVEKQSYFPRRRYANTPTRIPSCSGMGNHQSNQSRRKSNVDSSALIIGLLIAGFILCVLSFFWDQAVIQWAKTHDLKTLKNFAGLLAAGAIGRS